MAKKKITKKQKKQIQKVAKKHPILLTIVCLLIIAVVGCYLLHQKGIIHIPFLDNATSSQTSSPDDEEENSSQTSSPDDDIEVGAQGGAFTTEDISTISNGDLSIHFLEVGNKYTGDCTLIKVGNTEVLIDAGSRKGSAETLVPYIQQFCTDGVLEYVIATHAHQDHIAGFVGTTKVDGIFDAFVCETIIDYTLSNSTAQIRADYEALRDAEVAAGATHYTVLECWNNENGAQRSYSLGNGVTMNFLYQKFYEESTSDENDYSVCMLLSQGENNYLFTGDLEKHGEESLVASNNLPKCVLYKGGHHGSPTSSTAGLLSAIDPDIVCVCCCCGSDEYTDNVANMFPSQAFVDAIAPYTDQVYVTTIVSDNAEGYESLNGNIVVYLENGELKVRCSNNATLFKDTDWFKANRIMPDAWK